MASSSSGYTAKAGSTISQQQPHQRQQQKKAGGAAISKALVLRDYRLRLRDNIKSLRENFLEIIKLAKIDDDSQVARLTQLEHEQYEMQVRAANMARAAESTIKLVSDIKQFLILNDFAFVNETLATTSAECKEVRKLQDDRLLAVKEDATAFLQELEQEYYNISLRL